MSKTDYPSLSEDITADVAIVGGGLVGITSAYLLTKAGLKVALLEADRILHGTTGHTTAKITSQHSLIYARLKKEIGTEKAGLYAQANESALHMIADLVKEKQIDCDFERQSAYVYTSSPEYIKQIEEEVRVADSLGLNAVYCEDIPLSIKIEAAIRFDDQAQFHPLKYLLVLAQEVINQGGSIFEQTPVINIEKDSPWAVLTRKGNRIKANQIIVATHYPFFDGGGLYFSRIYAVKSYALGIRTANPFPGGMYISAEQPTRSLRAQKTSDGEIILVGGESHKTGQDLNTNTHYTNLVDYAKNTFEVLDIPYRWSTQDCMTTDGIPYIGRITAKTPSIYIATGFGKWGMTNGTVAALLIKDLLLGADNSWIEVFRPSRLNISSVTPLVTQNINVAKHFVVGKFKPAAENAQISKGEAMVIDVEGEKTGAYRDENGHLHLLDITCTHVGCELAWNDAERTWDCPCHGSRFSYNGSIIEGPALNPLMPWGEGENKVEPHIIP
ncbi:FAD dependent oxidoreductase [Syntrophomonas zehnderi OL-4]|uniref:FAD dependent oxidoreductase n=1 Tax=Syntrophomonas zehnderi OL-4 TaxID=690567 RepID=A0A0E4C7G4_9FIRM|nr:FAD-dependent oxidoreductase [Syntrophomonas zehnderi]CFX00568.1 FAD dependent oxidoreductase [Syntrophomonas zehnderi OL-4]